MTGQEVRQLLRQRRIFQWEVAQILGVAEFTFCRWLRGPLDSEKEQAILGAIEQLEKAERQG